MKEVRNEKIKDLIQKEINKNYILKNAILKLKIKEIFKEVSEEILGSNIKNNILILNVKSSAAKHYIILNKKNIMTKIKNKNEKFLITIDDIEVNL